MTSVFSHGFGAAVAAVGSSIRGIRFAAIALLILLLMSEIPAFNAQFPPKTSPDENVGLHELGIQLKALRKDNEQLRIEREDLKKQIEDLSDGVTTQKAAEEVGHNESYVEIEVPFWGWLFGRGKHQENVTQPEPEPVVKEGCVTLRCCILLSVDTILKGTWGMVNDPMGLFERWSNDFNEFVQDRLPLVSRVIGNILLFVVLNLLLYA